MHIVHFCFCLCYEFLCILHLVYQILSSIIHYIIIIIITIIIIIVFKPADCLLCSKAKWAQQNLNMARLDLGRRELQTRNIFQHTSNPYVEVCNIFIISMLITGYINVHVKEPMQLITSIMLQRLLFFLILFQSFNPLTQKWPKKSSHAVSYSKIFLMLKTFLGKMFVFS